MDNGHLSAELIGDYAEGLLSPAARQEADVHLQACARCRGDLESARAYFQDMAGLETFKAPSRFLTRVHARIDRASPWKRILAVLSSPRLLPVPIAATLMVSLGVYLAFLSREAVQDAPTVAAVSRADVETQAEAKPEAEADKDDKAGPAKSVAPPAPSAPAPAPAPVAEQPPVSEPLAIASPPPAAKAESFASKPASGFAAGYEAERKARPEPQGRLAKEQAAIDSEISSEDADEKDLGGLSLAARAKAKRSAAPIASATDTAGPPPTTYSLEWAAEKGSVDSFPPGLDKLGIKVLRHERGINERYELDVPSHRKAELEAYLQKFGSLTVVSGIPAHQDSALIRMILRIQHRVAPLP